MNKNELVGVVAEQTGLSKGDVMKAIDGMLEALTSAMQKGEEVRLVGFGTYTVTRRAASEGRNPRTGEPLTIAASKQPKFRPGKALKDAINSR